MNRVLMSATEIQHEIQKRINQIQEIIEDGKIVQVRGVQALAEFDVNGCNWSAEHFSNARGYESDILRVVAEVQAIANLRT